MADEIKNPQNPQNKVVEAPKEFQGVFSHGVLEGVEAQLSGSYEGTKYPAKCILNFSTLEKIVKDIKGTKLETMAKRNFKVSIPTTDDELADLCKVWDLKRNQFLELRMMPPKDGTFLLSNED
ncbi:MAG: hypothetical protein WC667_13190 [Sulfurimonas sp.]|jgi:hypothetical protein